MKKTKEETARSRARIVDAASRGFRERGFGGVSVKDLMNEAGLTHGAFYAHFPSKEALMSAACEEAFSETLRRLKPREDAAEADILARFLDNYLSPAHVERPDRGCAIPTLGAEAAREAGEVREAFSAGVAGMIAGIAELAPGADEAEKRARGVAMVAEAVGALMLARAVEPGSLRDEILGAVRRDLLGERA